MFSLNRILYLSILSTSQFFVDGLVILTLYPFANCIPFHRQFVSACLACLQNGFVCFYFSVHLCNFAGNQIKSYKCCVFDIVVCCKI